MITPARIPLTHGRVLALYRALIKKGVLAREEAVLLDEAVAQAIQAEAHTRRLRPKP
jgi:hypothetical protein